MNRIVFLLLAASLLVAACSHPAAPERPRPSIAATLGIPPGHLPPPGRCRIWIPGRPPGQQRRAGRCAVLAREVPPGGWLVFRPADDRRHVRVSIYHRKRTGVVVAIRLYEADSGRFVREVKP